MISRQGATSVLSEENERLDRTASRGFLRILGFPAIVI